MEAIGGNVRKIVAGGAAIAENAEMVMKKLKLPYTVGYGMTECGPLIGYRDPSTFKARSCGETVHRMEVRIDSKDPQNIVGEIQARGDNVMLGYYKNPDATSATFTDDGWLKTGDLGVVDNDGNIFIKGRSKSMILSANGQNIYPEEIEDKLNNLPLVAESIVVDREKKLVALVVPDYEKAAAESIEGDSLVKLMEENRNKLNDMLPIYSRITKFELREEAFEKTPKKVSRDLCIANRFTGLILAPYPFHGTQFSLVERFPSIQLILIRASPCRGTRSSAVWQLMDSRFQ